MLSVLKTSVAPNIYFVRNAASGGTSNVQRDVEVSRGIFIVSSAFVPIISLFHLPVNLSTGSNI